MKKKVYNEEKERLFNEYLICLEHAKNEYESEECDVSRIDHWLKLASIKLHEASKMKKYI